ncbi:MAG: lysophospholipid acyltransferase family protein [Candidatus Eisenbacteria bacterium]
MNDWPEFAARLRSTGQYRTPPDVARSRTDRMLGRFDWYYHLLVVDRVWRGGELAKRGRMTDPEWGQKCLDVIHCVERCGGKVQIEIPEATRTCTPCVYVGNHMSVLETITLPSVLLAFGHPTIVVKEALLRYPALCHTLRAVEPIAVTRTDPRDDLKTVLTKGAESLEAGRSVLVFPQATRSLVFDPSTFNSLGVKLAARAGVPVVPLALKTDFSGIGPIVKELGRIDREKTVHFRFGEPLDASSGGKATHAAVVDFIAASVREWGGVVA